MLRGQLWEARFVSRPNSFTVLASRGREQLLCHLHNPGRLRELLLPDARLLIKRADGEGRKTAFDLIGVRSGGINICLDTRISNDLVYEGLSRGAIRELTGYTRVVPEYRGWRSRFDFKLDSMGSKSCFLEVKSCTLVEEGRALFPDAPTERGARHLMDLAQAAVNGFRACALFVIHHPGGKIFAPNYKTDQKFARSLWQASSMGVEVIAYRASFEGRRIELRENVPSDLEVRA